MSPVPNHIAKSSSRVTSKAPVKASNNYFSSQVHLFQIQMPPKKKDKPKEVVANDTPKSNKEDKDDLNIEVEVEDVIGSEDPNPLQIYTVQ